MKKIFIAFLSIFTIIPIYAATAVQSPKSSANPAVQNNSPYKYELGQYNFKLDGDENNNEKSSGDASLKPIEKNVSGQNLIEQTEQKIQQRVEKSSEKVLSKPQEVVQKVKKDIEEEAKMNQNQTDIAPQYLQKTKSQSRIINQTQDTVKSQVKETGNTVKNEVQKIENTVKKETVKIEQAVKSYPQTVQKQIPANADTKNKSKSKSKKNKNADNDKPPVKFMIVPVQYQGESKTTIEKL